MQHLLPSAMYRKFIQLLIRETYLFPSRLTQLGLDTINSSRKTEDREGIEEKRVVKFRWSAEGKDRGQRGVFQ